MSVTDGFLDAARAQGEDLLARVLTRDHLHLAPRRISQAAGRRLKAGIAVLEAYLRRLIVLLALQIEPDLCPDQTPYTKTRSWRAAPPRPQTQPPFRSFERLDDFPREAAWIKADLSHRKPGEQAPGTPIVAAPLLARLHHLKTLLEAPEKRARQLAFHLARNRPGFVLTPGFGRAAIPYRFDPQLAIAYRLLGVAIHTAARARPPPIGPRPREGPRIRRV